MCRCKTALGSAYLFPRDLADLSCAYLLQALVARTVALIRLSQFKILCQVQKVEGNRRFTFSIILFHKKLVHVLSELHESIGD